MLPIDDRTSSPAMKYSMCWFPDVWSPFIFCNELLSRASLVDMLSLLILIPLYALFLDNLFFWLAFELCQNGSKIFEFFCKLLFFWFINMLQRSIHADRQLIYFQCCTNSSLGLFRNLSIHFRVFGLFDSCFCFYICLFLLLPTSRPHTFLCMSHDKSVLETVQSSVPASQHNAQLFYKGAVPIWDPTIGASESPVFSIFAST